MKKIIFSAVLLCTASIITANVAEPRCYKNILNLNGVCFHTYGSGGKINGTKCEDPGVGSSAEKNCTYGE